MRRSYEQKAHQPAFIIPLAHISSHQCEVLVTSLRSRLTIRCFELLKNRKLHTNTGSGRFLADGRLRLNISEASVGLTPHCWGWQGIAGPTGEMCTAQHCAALLMDLGSNKTTVSSLSTSTARAIKERGKVLLLLNSNGAKHCVWFPSETKRKKWLELDMERSEPSINKQSQAEWEINRQTDEGWTDR